MEIKSVYVTQNKFLDFTASSQSFTISGQMTVSQDELNQGFQTGKSDDLMAGFKNIILSKLKEELDHEG